MARTARAGRYRDRILGARGVPAPRTSRRCARYPRGARRFGGDPVRGYLPRPRSESAHQCRAPRHPHIAATCGAAVVGRHQSRPPHRFLRGTKQPGRGVHGSGINHRTAAGGIHHRFTRRAQRRYGHPGVRGIRASQSRQWHLPSGDFPGRDAGGARSHSQHRLHTGARICGQRTATAAAVFCCESVPG